MRQRRIRFGGLHGRNGALELYWPSTAAALFGISGNANGSATRKATAAQHVSAAGHEPLTWAPEQSQIMPPGERRAAIAATFGE